MNKWINIICYQAVWLVAIIGAADGMAWAGPVAVTAFAALQINRSTDRAADAYLIVVAAVVGFVVDSAFARSDALTYAAPLPSTEFAPVWIVALWINFSLTLNHSLAYLKSNLIVASLLGAIGGPLAYSAAATGWHAITFPSQRGATLIALAVVWAVVTPLLCVCAKRFSERHPAVVLGGAA